MARNWVDATMIFLVAALSVSASSSPSENAGNIVTYLQEGNDALAAGDYQAAIRSYEACLALDPDERYCNINYAISLVDDSNESEKDDDDAKRERTARAMSALRHVLSSHPRDGDAAFNLALLLQDSSRSEETTRESASLYQIAVEAMEMDPDEDDRWDALANLAAARQELGEHFGPYGSIRSYERAIVMLEGMIQEYNAYIDGMINDHEAATTEYDDEGYHYAQTQVLTMNAYTSKLYYGYGTILSDLSPSDCLRLMAEESLLIDTERTTSFAIRTVGKDEMDEKSAKVVCETNALNAMRMAVNLDGNNFLASHILAAMTGGEDDDDGGYGSQERASNEFVSALFDDFADTFDEKLGALAYQVPKLVGEVAYDLLRMSQKESFDSILDAGCGTGLAGRFLRPLVGGPLVGVDLSNQMLQKAAQCTLARGCGLKVEDSTVLDDAGVDGRSSKPLYDKLALSDLETVALDDLISGLSGEKLDGFDLIVAADVFVYIGNLEKILLNFAKLSIGDDSKESYLIFSCERIDDEKAPSAGWKVQSSGRYAHTKSYVKGVAESAGFDLLRYEKIVPRMEKGEEVKGHLFVFIKGGVADEHDFDEDSEYGVHVEVFHETDSHLEDREPIMDEL
jgi:predicted TPR repeat methyltransferase